jgi:hypothetical protein
MVGTAEIVYAMGNVHQRMLENETDASPDYREVFYWAAVDVLAALEGVSHDAVWKDKGWKRVADEEVLQPSGRLFNAYTEMATYIRRTTISQQGDQHPRQLLEPVAKSFLENHRQVLARFKERSVSDPVVKEYIPAIEDVIRTIEGMFPNLKEALPDANPPA